MHVLCSIQWHYDLWIRIGGLAEVYVEQRYNRDEVSSLTVNPNTSQTRPPGTHMQPQPHQANTKLKTALRHVLSVIVNIYGSLVTYSSNIIYCFVHCG